MRTTRTYSVTMGSLLCLATALPAQAQAAEADDLELEEVIVTGSIREERRFDVSYAVNGLSQGDVQRLAPLNMADLVGKLPGIQVETTGGDVGNITRVRGIPTDDGYLLFQQDGLPLYHDILGVSFKGDTLNRYDLMTERMEVVRGGPAPVFSSQAAAIANSVTVTGSQTSKGKVRLTAGSTDLYRLDMVQSGPIGEDTYYAIGGFLREDDGQRDNGFKSDSGGQLRANISHDFEYGSLKVTGLYLDDHNAFYLPIPLADPRNPAVSLDPYIDYFEGTLNSPVFRNVKLPYLDGSGQLQTRTRDLDNARHMKLSNGGIHYDGAFSDWLLSFHGSYSKGELDFDGFYSTSLPVDAAAFATTNLTSAARVAFPTATRLGYALAGTAGREVYDPRLDSGLVMLGQYRAITVDIYSGQGDLSLARKFEVGPGTQDVKVGVYGSSYGIDVLSAYQDHLIQVKGRPQMLDLVAYDATGGVAGYITADGVYRYTTTLIGGEADTTMWAAYANDTWDVTSSLRIDAGVRHERYAKKGYSLLTGGQNLGDTTTLADDAVRRFTGVVQNTARDDRTTSWTAGVNYDFTDRFGGYVRASHLEAPPSTGLNVQVNQVYVKTKADQYETGLKVSAGRSYLYLTGFYTNFDPLNSSFIPFDPVTGQTSTAVPFISEVQVKGIEADGALSVSPWFTIGTSLTFQDPTYSNLQSSAASGASPAAVEGKQVIREPKFFGNVRPAFSFEAAGAHFDLYGRYEYTSKRYVDFLNITELPAFHSISAGVTAAYQTWEVQLVGDNLTNAEGLTEGNNRIDQLSGQGTRTAIYGRPVFGRSFRLMLSKSW